MALQIMTCNYYFSQVILPTMIPFLITILVFVCILLVTVVLMQASKGGGLIGAIGGTNVSTMFGARRTSDFLSKTTVVLAIIFLLSSLLLNLYISNMSDTSESIIQTQSGSQQLPPPTAPPQNQLPGGDQTNPETNPNNPQTNPDGSNETNNPAP